jgi:uncharacterized protein (TIGR00369 family)
VSDDRLAQWIDWFNELPVLKAMGATCERLEPGHSHASLETDSELNNPNGAVPGTTLAAFVDVVGGMAVSTVCGAEEWFATLHLGINFMRPAFGTRFTGRSEVLRRGRGHTWVRVDVLDDSERVCVAAEGTWSMIPGAPDTPETTRPAV